MKVTLNIDSDEELRSHIKEAIRGQVISLAREDAMLAIKDEFTKKVKAFSDGQFKELFNNAMHAVVKDVLQKEHKVSSWNNEFILPYVVNVLTTVLERVDWDKLVNELAVDKIKNLVK